MLNKIKRCKPLLGTFIEVSVNGQRSSEELNEVAQCIFDKIQMLEKVMSYYDKNSEVFRVNKFGYKNFVDVSDELLELLKFSIKLSAMSNGLLDITVGGKMSWKKLIADFGFAYEEKSSYKDIIIEGNKVCFAKKTFIDLGGVAKGYIVDKAMEKFLDSDLDIVVNAGGDLKMNKWQGKIVKIRVPDKRKLDKFIEVEMKNSSLATSAGYYKNILAIFNKKKNKFEKNLDSISVFAKDCMVCDSLTKILFMLDKSDKILLEFGAEAFKLNKFGEKHVY